VGSFNEQVWGLSDERHQQFTNTLLVKTPWYVVAEGVSAPADVGARRARGRAAAVASSLRIVVIAVPLSRPPCAGRRAHRVRYGAPRGGPVTSEPPHRIDGIGTKVLIPMNFSAKRWPFAGVPSRRVICGVQRPPSCRPSAWRSSQ